MPPDASSRSRTYFPKIWGNTPTHRTSPFWLPLWSVPLVLGCHTVPGPELTHAIRAHWMKGCLPTDAQAVRIDLTALGDFDPSPDTFETFDDAADATDVPLVAPVATRAVTLDATDDFASWTGLATRDPGGDTDVSLWSTSSACRIVDPDGATYPASQGGQGVGVTRDGRVALIVGGEGGGATAAGALTVDLGTGLAAPVSPDDGPRTHRAGATVTPFGDGLLVAGGYDPESSAKDPLGSADVFDVTTRSFEPGRLALERPRAHHATLELASGEALLIGGENADHQLLRTLEAISPISRTYRISLLTDLSLGRRDPVALRLSDGRLFVAGGTDDSGDAVDEMEWLTEDASSTDRVLSFSEVNSPTTSGRAFAAMPGGSVLVAGGCVQRIPSDAERVACSAVCGDGQGCPSREVWWITRDGAATALPDALDIDAADATLVAGSEGRPWLVARSTDANGAVGPQNVRRFEPFSAKFVAVDANIAPTYQAIHFEAADSGLFVWLDADDIAGRSALSGFRHGVRNAFAANVSSLLAGDATGVALDRPRPLAELEAPNAVTLNAPGATLVLTDVTYADVHLTMTVASVSAATAAAPPLVRLGNLEFGSHDCPWPKAGAVAPSTAQVAPSTAQVAPSAAQVDRVGDRVILTLGKATRSCAGPTGRVSVWLEAVTPVQLTSVTASRAVAQ